MIIGAGVAGLSAIGTAMSLGAIVRAFDTRPEVKEQVESMGAEFLELEFEEEGSGAGGYAKVMSKEFIDAEMALFAAQAKEVDIIITTALIPGRPAPKLITAEMVKSMKPGSVVVDLAAEQGGNCELTQPDSVVDEQGVKIIGYTDLPSRLPAQSSQLYASNVRNFLDDLCPDQDGKIHLNMEDEVIRGATVVKDGEVTWPPPQKELPPAKLTETSKSDVQIAQQIATKPKKPKFKIAPYAFGLALLSILGIGLFGPPSFLSHFTVFVLAIFVGWHVIWNVKPALHTPLMSVTNAISGIIIVGALLEIGAMNPYVKALAAVSILIASVNIFGGFFCDSTYAQNVSQVNVRRFNQLTLHHRLDFLYSESRRAEPSDFSRSWKRIRHSWDDSRGRWNDRRKICRQYCHRSGHDGSRRYGWNSGQFKGADDRYASTRRNLAQFGWARRSVRRICKLHRTPDYIRRC
jgi:NAD(P) transhydrogenase subunit alpha